MFPSLGQIHYIERFSMLETQAYLNSITGIACFCFTVPGYGSWIPWIRILDPLAPLYTVPGWDPLELFFTLRCLYLRLGRGG